MDKQNKNSKNNTSGRNNKGNKNWQAVLLCVIALCLVIGIVVWNIKSGIQTKETDKTNAGVNKTVQTESGDIRISLSDLSTQAAFFDVKIDGTKMELLAVKASDGSIHTAFNTCQVCYSSGRGYYVQEGDELVCQNCGNRFPIDQVGVTRNGCNPVPILENERTIDNSSITVSGSFLKKYVAIFENWKTT